MPFIGLEGTRQSEIARRAGMTKQGVGQLVEELASRGYVELARRAISRARLVRFTLRGLALRECGFRLKRDVQRCVATAVSPDQLDQIETALRNLVAVVRRADSSLDDGREPA